MKKIIYIVVSIMILFNLASCNSKKDSLDDDKNQVQDEKPNIEQDFEYVFLGEYNGYEILFKPSTLSAIGTETIAGYEFIHPTLFAIYARKDENMFLLVKAYEAGELQKEDIESIYKSYLDYMKNIYPSFYEIMQKD